MSIEKLQRNTYFTIIGVLCLLCSWKFSITFASVCGIISHIFSEHLWSKYSIITTFLNLEIARSQQTFLNHYVKSVSIRSYSGPHFPAFSCIWTGCGEILRIQSKCRKMQEKFGPIRILFMHAEPLTVICNALCDLVPVA